MSWLKKQPGQMLVELILAVAITGSLAGLTTVALVDIGGNMILNDYRLQANQWTEEGIDALRSIRNISWESLINATYPAHPVIVAGSWQLVVGSENNGIFTRQMIITDVYRDINGNIAANGTIDPNSKKFTVQTSWSWRAINRTINREIILTRFVNNQNWQETTQTDFDDGSKNYVVTQASEDGEITLAPASGQIFGEVSWGNRILASGVSQTAKIDDPNKTIDIRFSVESDLTNIFSIYVYPQEDTAETSTRYAYGIQNDNQGRPSGNWLSNDAQGELNGDQISAGQWNTLSFTAPIGLSAGQIYHFVFYHTNGPANNNDYVSFRVGAPGSRVHVFSGNDEVNRAILYCNSCGKSNMATWPNKPWLDDNQTPLFLLNTAPAGQSFVDGNPYSNISEVSVGDLTLGRGEKFVYKGGGEIISRLGTIVKRSSLEPPSDLTMMITDEPEGNLYGTAIIPKSEITTSFAYHEANLNQPITLQSNQTYRIIFSTSLVPPGAEFFLPLLESPDSSPYFSRNFGGVASVYFHHLIGFGSWQDYPDKDLPFWLKTTGTTSGYQPAGDYTSSFLTMTNYVGFHRLQWTENLPAGTDIQLQVDASDDGVIWNGFVGPDGTGLTFFTEAAGTPIPLLRSRGRYFRYKAFLSTTNTMVTPVLQTVNINYSP